MEESFKVLRDAFMSVWEAIKDIAQWFESDDRYEQPIHPALRTRKNNSFIMVPQVLINKPNMIHARTNC